MNYISKKQHIINWLFFKNEERSIFRKAFRVFIFTLPAYMANLGLLYLAPRLVNGETFGIFFVSNTIINWMFAPAIIISMYLLRDITNPQKIQEAGSLPLMAKKIINLVAKWSMIVMLTLGALSFFLAYMIGISSLYLIPLIFLIISLAYVGESFRVYFQAAESFWLLGSLNMSWMVTRFMLGSSGLYLFQTAWGGLLGISLALSMVFFAYYQKFIRVHNKYTALEHDYRYHPPTIIAMLPGILSYSTLILACNIDIIIGYFVLDSSMLGIYSASSVLAKAILVLSFPLTHSIYPVLLTNKNQSITNNWLIFFKGLLLTSLIAGTVILLLYSFSWLVCSSDYGIKGCNSEIYRILLIPPFFLFLLVFLSLHSFSSGNDWFPLLLCIPTAIYIITCFVYVHEIKMLSQSFAIFSFFICILYFALVLNSRRKTIPCMT